jgi:hypothetical protein
MSRCQVPDCESVGMYRKLVAITQVAQAGSRETGVQKTSVFCTPKLPYFKRSFQAGTFNQPDSVCRQCLHGISFGRTSLAYRFGVQKTDVLCTAKLGRTENFLFLYTVGVKPLKPLALAVVQRHHLAVASGRSARSPSFLRTLQAWNLLTPHVRVGPPCTAGSVRKTESSSRNRPSMPHHKQDLARHSPCSARS